MVLMDCIALGVQEKNVFYVGKHGNDSNTGLTIDGAFLTFGAALSAASGATAATPYAINCLDDGIYAENITGVSYVDIFAPSANLTGSITGTDYEYIKFKLVTYTGSGYAISKGSGSNYLNISVDTIILGTSSNGISCSSGFTNFEWKQLYVVNGYGIGNYTGGETHIHLKGGDIYVGGTGYALTCVGTNSMVGRIDHIIDNGTGAGHGILGVEGEIDLNISRIEGLNTAISIGTTSLYSPVANLQVDVINCTKAYLVGSTGTLNLSCGNITGTTSITSGGVFAESLFASSTGTSTQVLIGNASGNPTWGQVDLTADVTGVLPPANGGRMTWSVVGASGALSVNTGIICKTGAALSFSLPGSSAVGDMVAIVLDGSTSWTITEGTGQRIRFGSSQTTTTTGSLASTAQGDSVLLVCSVASTLWNVVSSIGNITVV